jgi:hypothetical protein
VTAAPLAEAVGEIVPHGAVAQATVQETPLFVASLVTVAVNCAVVPAATVAVPGDTEMLSPGTVTFAEAAAPELVTEVAVIVTAKSPAGWVAGAVYLTAAPLAEVVGEIEPQSAAEQLTVQVTPPFEGSLLTVAVNGALPPGCTVAEGGVTETERPGIVMAACADFVGSATEVAVMVTVLSPVLVAPGAVYASAAPLAVWLVARAPQAGPEHEIAQETPIFDESFATVAVTITLAPACTVADVGVTFTLIGNVVVPPLLQAARTNDRATTNPKGEERTERFIQPPKDRRLGTYQGMNRAEN